MTNYVPVGNLQIAEQLYDFVNKEAIPETGLDKEKFWLDLGKLITDLSPKNKALLQEREEIQKKIDAWYRDHSNFDANEYKEFLKEIGYLEPEVEDFYDNN